MSGFVAGGIAHTATVVATSVLFTKFTATILIQGKKRFDAGSRPPEDVLLKPHGERQAFKATRDDSAAAMDDMRWQRIVQNDLENIPLGLIIAWGTMLSPASAAAHAALVSMFAAFRVGHTIAYAKASQPARSYMWAGGVVCTFGMVLNGIVGVL